MAMATMATMATTLQRDVVIGCNNYLNAAIIFMQTRSGQFARSLSHALSPFLFLSLLLSRSFRIISQFSQFYCYYHEESDYYYYYYYYYAGFKNTHFGMCMHMHGILKIPNACMIQNNCISLAFHRWCRTASQNH